MEIKELLEKLKKFDVGDSAGIDKKHDMVKEGYYLRLGYQMAIDFIEIIKLMEEGNKPKEATSIATKHCHCGGALKIDRSMALTSDQISLQANCMVCHTTSYLTVEEANDVQ